MQTQTSENTGQRGLYPLRFKPVYKDYVWGGDKIIRHFHRDEPPGVYAESWEVADRPEGMSVVANGPLAGKTLRELFESMGSDLIGTVEHSNKFPLLIKILDAREKLSVQVHPDERATNWYGGEPKTEMWYVLEAEKDAVLYCGLRSRVKEEEFRAAVRLPHMPELLEKISVAEGDSIFVPGGRVHAIGAGCLLLEVQQNSDTTYRIFDWGREGRELHIKEALQVIRWENRDVAKVRPRKRTSRGKNEFWTILVAPQFKVEKMVLSEPQQLLGGGIFQVLFVAKGNIQIEAEGFKESASAGTTYLVPASVDRLMLNPEGGRAEVLRITCP